MGCNKKGFSVNEIINKTSPFWAKRPAAFNSSNADGKTLVASLNKKSVEAPIKQGETVGDYQITIAGNLGFVDGSTDLKTKALAANGVEGINIFIKWWQMLSDAI